MVTSEDILAYMRQSRERFAQLYRVRRIGIFGSVARGEARGDSDLDVLVDMASRPSIGTWT